MDIARARPEAKPDLLPEKWIRKLFAELQGNYGSRFVDMWRTGQTLPDGTDAGLKHAMLLWRERLSGFENDPERIRKALGALPPYPPTLPEFIALCRQHQTIKATQAPVSRLPREELVPHIARLAQCISRSRVDLLGWAYTPPSPEQRGPWGLAIIECVKRGDSRFVRILADHIASGVMQGEAARTVLMDAGYVAQEG